MKPQRATLADTGDEVHIKVARTIVHILIVGPAFAVGGAEIATCNVA